MIPNKGGKKAKVEEGYKRDTMSDDNEAGPPDETQISMCDLTPKIPAVAQEEFGQPPSSNISTATYTTPVGTCERGDITPDFRLDSEPSLQEQIDLSCSAANNAGILGDHFAK